MKDKQTSNQINKVVLIGTILIVLIVLIIIGILIKRNNEGSQNPDPEILSKEDAINYFYQNYLISYIIYGDVETGEGVSTDNETGITYYAVTDEKLKDYKSIDKIMELITTTLREDNATKAINKLNDGNHNTYVESKDTLYILKKKATCEIPDVNKNKIIYQKGSSDYIELSYNNMPNQLYLDETVGKWYMPFLTYDCDLYEDTPQNEE